MECLNGVQFKCMWIFCIVYAMVYVHRVLVMEQMSDQFW